MPADFITDKASPLSKATHSPNQPMARRDANNIKQRSLREHRRQFTDQSKTSRITFPSTLVSRRRTPLCSKVSFS